LAYETGYYSADDVRRLGLGMLALTMVVVSLTMLYWGWLGLPLTPFQRRARCLLCPLPDSPLD